MKLAADGTQFLTARMGPGGMFGDVLAGSHATKSPVTVAARQPGGGALAAVFCADGVRAKAFLQNYIAPISDKYFALDRRVELLLCRGVGKSFVLPENRGLSRSRRRGGRSRAALASYLGCERSALCRETGPHAQRGAFAHAGPRVLFYPARQAHENHGIAADRRALPPHAAFSGRARLRPGAAFCCFMLRCSMHLCRPPS